MESKHHGQTRALARESPSCCWSKTAHADQLLIGRGLAALERAGRTEEAGGLMRSRPRLRPASPARALRRKRTGRTVTLYELASPCHLRLWS
jgi:hypothetical protein